MKRQHLYTLGAVLLASAALSACGSGAADLMKAMASDPAAVSVRQSVTAPGWQITTEVTRANSAGTSVAASQNGVSINVPAGATANAPIPPAPK